MIPIRSALPPINLLPIKLLTDRRGFVCPGIFEKSGSACFALRPGNGGCMHVLARRARKWRGSGAGVVPRASARYDVVEESGRARLALGLANGGYVDVLARRTGGVLDGDAGIGLGAAARRVGFEKSKRASLTYRLGGAGAGYHGVLARRALAVRSATTIGTTYIYNIGSRMRDGGHTHNI